jgi:multicomponent Na+:H+ antiporter subunit E
VSEPTVQTAPIAGSVKLRSVLMRSAGFSAFWLLLAAPLSRESADLAADLAVGLCAVAAATWASYRLIPADSVHIRFGALLRLLGRFLWQSILGGLDVAWRAMQPRPGLKTGYLAFPVRLPPGSARAGFGALTSLVPGTLPLGSDPQGRLLYHCLDMDLPIAESLAADEKLFAAAFDLPLGRRS